jgi:hypothetical protein
MKKLATAIALLFVVTSFAQITYLQYRHVPAEHEDKFIERETKHWSKVAKAAIDNGDMASWSLWRKVGTLNSEDTSPNYVFVNSFDKLDQLDTDGVWTKAMEALGDVKAAEVETYSFTKTSFDYYVQQEAVIPGEYKYAIVNYAKPTDRGAFIEENKTLWMPLHKTAIKNGGGMTAWSMSTVVYPRGNQDRFSVFTVDGFAKLSHAMEYLRYQSPNSSSDDTASTDATAAANTWNDVLSKSKMSEILPDGFEYSIIYERVMTITKDQ